MNIIGNLSELTEQYNPSSWNHKSIEDVITEIANREPELGMMIEYKDGGDLIFKFKSRFGNLFVYEYQGSVS